MGKTRLIKESCSWDVCDYIVEFTPPLRLSDLRPNERMEISSHGTPKSMPIRYASITATWNGGAVYATNEAGDQDTRYPEDGNAEVVRVAGQIDVNDLLAMIGRDPIRVSKKSSPYKPGSKEHEAWSKSNAGASESHERGSLGEEDDFSSIQPRRKSGPRIGTGEKIAYGVAAGAVIGYLIGKNSRD